MQLDALSHYQDFTCIPKFEMGNVIGITDSQEESEKKFFDNIFWEILPQSSLRQVLGESPLVFKIDTTCIRSFEFDS